MQANIYFQIKWKSLTFLNSLAGNENSFFSAKSSRGQDIPTDSQLAGASRQPNQWNSGERRSDIRAIIIVFSSGSEKKRCRLELRIRAV